MYNKHIKIFENLSKIYEKLGDDIRATSYHNLSKKLQLYDIKRKKDKSFQLTGVTKKSQRKIDEISKTGKLKILEDIKKENKDKLKLIEIIGVGPSMADKLIKNGIKNYKEFRDNYTGKITQLQKIGLKYHGKIKKPKLEIFYKIVKIFCKEIKGVNDIAIAGSYRTGNQNPNDIDIIVCSGDGKIKNIIESLVKMGILVDFSMSGKEDIFGIIKLNNKFYKIDIKVTVPKYFASYMLYFGSGKYFSKYIRGVAKGMGYKLNQYGIEIIKTGETKTFRSEKAIFKFLHLKYLTPQERVLYF
jgi:DNA polymerase (family 10)